MPRLSCRVATACSVAVAVAPSLAVADTVVTDRPFVRHDGGTDPVIARCSSDDPSHGSGNERENESSVAIRPGETSVIASGANEYCPDVPWQGIYLSQDGGNHWVDSLIPGYPGDTSTEGRASPLSGKTVGASDPTLDWDDSGNLFFGGIAFNEQKPVNGVSFVATYRRDPNNPLGVDYQRTVVVGEGTPSARFEGSGRFNDKTALKVDDWPSSPARGNVYLAWGLFPGRGGQPQILFARSTDSGRTFSKPIKLSRGEGIDAFADVATGPDGTVYVFWRHITKNGDAFAFAKSTDGGRSFSAPQDTPSIVSYDRIDSSPFGDCGDGPDLCTSHFVFHRTGTMPQAAVAQNGTVHVAWDQTRLVGDNGDTYHPDGQAQAVVMRSTNGGRSWSAPSPIDAQAMGHQFFTALEYDKVAHRLVAAYQDSRTDPSYSPTRPPGNTASGTSVCGTPTGSQACNLVNTFIATSTNGTDWTATKVSSLGHQPEYEMFDNRQVPFQGDYLGVDAVAGTSFAAWTDNRDVIPGQDPRESTQDGFDVLQCRASPDAADTCPNAGGLNQNIYGARLP